MSQLVSILTPTWNRCDYLDRLWHGLNSQTYKNIEWIVADDGSTDGTASKLRELRAKSSFPVIIITANIRIGKARMDNEAVNAARGEFILWNDSDDYLLPQAIDELVSAWKSIPNKDRNEFVGVTALCGDGKNALSTKLPKNGIFDTTWNDLRMKFEVAGDMVYFTRSTYLKKNPFPEVDFLVSEGAVWTSIGHLRTRVIPKVLKIVEYGSLNCISFSKKMEYCRGKAYALAICKRNTDKYHKKLIARLWILITFIRYCIHGEISFSKATQLWGKNSILLFLTMIPFALFFVLKDTMQGKVKKTHRHFQIATKSVVVTIGNSHS